MSSRDAKKRLAAFVSFAIPLVLIVNYHLNHWYVSGAYFLDSGWFAYLSAQAGFPDMLNPPVIGGSFLEYHISPVLWLYSAIKQLIPGLADAIYFSLIQGFWVGLLGLTTFFACERLCHHLTLSLLTAIVSALNGITLAIIGFPHIELAIPVLIVVLMAIQRLEGAAIVATAVPLVVLLFVREDAGLHLFGLFFVLSLYFFFHNKALFKRFAILAFLAMGYSIAAILLQNLFFSEHRVQLANVYTGSPAYAHLSVEFLAGRINFFLENREYIYLPLGITLAFGLIKKDWLLLLGTASTFPWIAFSLTAYQSLAGTLVSYYAFPLMLILLWPMLSASLAPKKDGWQYVVLQLALAFISIASFPGNKGLHDPNPAAHFGFQYVEKLAPTAKAIAIIHSNIDDFGQVVVDDAIASLIPADVNQKQWHYYAAYDLERAYTYDTVIYFKNAFSVQTFEALAKNSGLSRRYALNNTSVVVATNRPLHTDPLFLNRVTLID